MILSYGNRLFMDRMDLVYLMGFNIFDMCQLICFVLFNKLFHRDDYVIKSSDVLKIFQNKHEEFRHNRDCQCASF